MTLLPDAQGAHDSGGVGIYPSERIMGASQHDVLRLDGKTRLLASNPPAPTQAKSYLQRTSGLTAALAPFRPHDMKSKSPTLAPTPTPTPAASGGSDLFPALQVRHFWLWFGPGVEPGVWG